MAGSELFSMTVTIILKDSRGKHINGNREALFIFHNICTDGIGLRGILTLDQQMAPLHREETKSIRSEVTRIG